MNTIAILVGIGTLITIVMLHELGHLLAAKSVGIPVSVFSFGFGPKVIGCSWRGTDYRLSLFPIGGYVRMGTGDEADDIDLLDRFTKLRRLAFLAGGILANFTTAWLVLSFAIIPTVLRKRLDHEPLRGRIVISDVMPGSKADRAGIRKQDVIMAAAGSPTLGTTPASVIGRFRDGAGTPLPLTVLRDGRRIDITVVPATGGRIGVLWKVHDPMGRLRLLPSVIPEAFAHGTRMTGVAFSLIWKSITGIADGKASVDDVSGPIGIARVGADAFRAGWLQMAMIFCFLSVNIGMFNAFPLPGLDGGHMAFLAVEAAFGRPVPTRIRTGITMIGVLLMLLTVLMVMFLDIRKEVGRHGAQPPTGTASR